VYIFCFNDWQKKGEEKNGQENSSINNSSPVGYFFSVLQSVNLAEANPALVYSVEMPEEYLN
jgi:hypothetical protein